MSEKPKNAEQLYRALAKTETGSDERKQLIADKELRALITIQGANITVHTTLPYAKTLRRRSTVNIELIDEFARSIRLLLVERIKGGKIDGLGAIGGLAEYATNDEFAERGADLLGQKDNVAINDFGVAAITKDGDIIAEKAALREAREELVDELGIRRLQIYPKRLKKMPVPIHDNHYVIHRWKKGDSVPVYAVDATCFTHDIPYSSVRMAIKQASEAKKKRQAENADMKQFEIQGLREITLIDALGRFGSGDLSYDYRYGHEWLVAWFIAAKLIKQSWPETKDQKAAMQWLGASVQKNIFSDKKRHYLDFDAVLKEILPLNILQQENTPNKRMAFLDRAFGLPQGSFKSAQEAARKEKIFLNRNRRPLRGNNRNNNRKP